MVEKSEREDLYSIIDGKVRLSARLDRRDQTFIIKEKIYFQSDEDSRRAKELSELLPTLSNLRVAQGLGDFKKRTSARLIYKQVKSTLFQEINKRTGPMPFSKEEVTEILCTTVETLAALQKKGIAHRNISPSYLQISTTGKYYLCMSFFSKSEVPYGTSSQTGLEAAKYLSPLLKELMIAPLKKVKHDQYRSDVFSLGITILELILLKIPKKIKKLRNLEENINNVLNRLVGSEYPDWLIGVLRRMLKVEESERPDFIELKRLIEEMAEQPDFTQLRERLQAKKVFPRPVANFERNANPQSLLLRGVWGIRCIISCSRKAPGEILCNLSFQVTDFPHFILLMDKSGSTAEQKDDMIKFHDKFQSCVPNCFRRSLICFSDEREHTNVYIDETNAEKCSSLFALQEHGDMSDVGYGILIAHGLHKEIGQGSVLMVVSDGCDNCRNVESALQLIERDLNLAVHCYQVKICDSTEENQMGKIAEAGNSECVPLEECLERDSQHFSDLFSFNAEVSVKEISGPDSLTAPISLSASHNRASLDFLFGVNAEEGARNISLQLEIACPRKAIEKYIVLLRLEDSTQARSTTGTESAEQ